MVGFIYFWISRKIITNWAKNLFIINGIVFMMIAFSISIAFLYKNKTEVKAAFEQIIRTDEVEDTIYTDEPKENETNKETKDVITHADSIQLEAPLIAQLPKLPRGCEVTSLAMLLEFHGVDTDIMVLADE